MIPSNFDYIKAGSVDEAIGLLQDTDAKLLAGGHSLLPAMKLRLSSPSKLIDISQIADLRFINDKGDHLSVGPATTHYGLESSELVQSKILMLSEVAGSIGDLQVRNKGTIGGSIAHADPAADWPASLVATEAEIVVKGANGERSIAATDFFTGLFTTALQEDEIIIEIKIPIPPANSGTSYQKFMQPASRFAIVGCAAVVTKSNGNCERVRVAFSGLGDNAFRATTGDGQYRVGHHRRGDGPLRAERLQADDRAQQPAEHPPAGRRGAVVHGQLRGGHRGERATYPRVDGVVADAGDGPQRAHRLRQRGEDRQESPPRRHHAARSGRGARPRYGAAARRMDQARGNDARVALAGATGIPADVIGKMSPRAPASTTSTVQEWVRGFERHAAATVKFRSP